MLYGTEPERDAPASPSSSVASTDLTLFIGLIVAFIIFLVVVICMIKILRNKSVAHPTYNLTTNPGTGGKKICLFLSFSNENLKKNMYLNWIWSLKRTLKVLFDQHFIKKLDRLFNTAVLSCRVFIHILPNCFPFFLILFLFAPASHSTPHCSD